MIVNLLKETLEPVDYQDMCVHEGYLPSKTRLHSVSLLELVIISPLL